MRVLLVETEQADHFSPLAWTRPVFELLCGTRSLRQRILDVCRPTEWGVVVRPHLEKIYRAEFPEAFVNDIDWMEAGPVYVIHGAWAGDPGAVCGYQTPGVLRLSQGEPVSWLKQPEQGAGHYRSLPDLQNILQTARQHTQQPEYSCPESSGQLLHYPWDLVNHNSNMLARDYELLVNTENFSSAVAPSLPGLSANSDARNVLISPSAQLEPLVAINAAAGPVIIDDGASIQAFTRLEGPCYIGKQTQLFRANIRGGTSIGPVCRVGGEVEASIFHGYANKYHDGFLGHSYVCPWVNLGALTTNSDLKNDYTAVKFPQGTGVVNSGEKKVGCFIGDHAKTAIGTLFNTGSNIGIMAMVLPAGRLCPKHIPSFSRLWHGVLDADLDFAAACTTAATAMQRRGETFTELHRQLFEQLRELTAEERTATLNRKK